MLKQLLLLVTLFTVVRCAQKQYAYAYGYKDKGFQCKEAPMIFTELFTGNDLYTFYEVADTRTENLIGGLWTIDRDYSYSGNEYRNQVDFMMKDMATANTYVKTHYIVVLDKYPQRSDYYLNIIKALIIRGNQHGLEVGIYTSTDDWIRVTGNSTDPLPVKVPLWWINDGGRDGDDTPDNFDDFVPFGPFDRSNLVMKQFSTKHNDCGVGKSVYFV